MDFGVINETDGNKIVTKRFEAILIQRDTALASGNQVIVGLGFKPLMIMAWGADTVAAGEASWGRQIDGQAIAISSLLDNHQSVANTFDLANDLIFIKQGVGVQYTGTIASYDADGFTITWTRTGAPTGIITFVTTAFK